jgi:hypothetical protein
MTVSSNGISYPIQGTLGKDVLAKSGEITLIPNAPHMGQARNWVEGDAVDGLVQILDSVGVLDKVESLDSLTN